MAKVPGMGWLASRNANEANIDPMAAYPAPSASAVPTTITDSRTAATNAMVAGNVPSQNAGGYSASPAAANIEYPETQHASLPPAAAAPRTVTPSNAYTSAVSNQVPNPGHAMAPPAPNGIPANLNDDVQRGSYPPANSGSATTWGAMADNGPATGATSPSTTATWNANGAATQTAPGYQPDPRAVASRGNGDFAPLSPSSAAPPGSTVAPASYQTHVPPTTNPLANEFARHDQGGFVNPSSPQQAIHTVVNPTVETNTHSLGNPSTVQQAVHTFPVATTSTSSPNAPTAPFGASPPAMATTPASFSAPTAGSHYATIAADQGHGARNGPWRPGSTSRLEGGGTTVGSWNSQSAAASTASSRAASGASPAGISSWD